MQFSETIDAAFKREEERQTRQIGQLHRYARAHIHRIAYEDFYKLRLEQLQEEYAAEELPMMSPRDVTTHVQSLYTEAMKALDESEARYCRRTVIELCIIAVGIVALAAVAFLL